MTCNVNQINKMNKTKDVYFTASFDSQREIIVIMAIVQYWKYI